MGTPNEEIGFQASEEYASRMSSPRPQSSGFQVAHSNASQTHVDSPLRKSSFPADTPTKNEFEKTLSRSLHAPSDTALESEREDDDVIHVQNRRTSRVYGSDLRYESTEDLGTPGEPVEEPTYDEGYSAPILASDEVAKEPFGWELQPAVSPLHERRSSQDYSFYQQKSASQTSLSGSRPSSRPGSIHGNLPGLRFPSEKLEDLEEYEPLFPEDEKNASKQKPLTAADRLKMRPELRNRKFPSQDVWEDTPNSLQYTATVSTPQLPEDEVSKEEPETETPEQAFARRQEELAESESSGTESFLHFEKKKPWADKAHLIPDTRPGMKQRFPSRDIWEDTPDSLQLHATVGGPQATDKEILSPPEAVAIPAKPSIPARPVKSKLSQSPEKSQPSVPERPVKKNSLTDTTSPPLPAKAKPVIPARPSKPITRDSGENVPLVQVTSNSSAKSVGSDQGATAAAKPKPPVPSRPVGSKIAALQGGFMADLNKRLQLGAQPPKKEEVAPEEPEEVKEKAPLSDARKGRARGPARRAPAKSPAPAVASDVSEKSTAALGFCIPSTVWEIDPDEDMVYVADKEAAPVITKDVQAETKAAQSETPTLATNTAGESLHASSEIASETEKDAALSSKLEDAHAEILEKAQEEKASLESAGNNHEHEPVSVKEEPVVKNLAPEEDLTASTSTVKGEVEQETAEKSVE